MRTLLASLPLLAACTFVDPADDAPEVAVQDEALTTPTWMSPACDETSLESPPDTCDGPWVYSWSCWDPVQCGASSTCLAYNTCTSWHVGIDVSNVTETAGPYLTFGSPTPQSKCTTLATNRENAILAMVPSDAPGYIPWYYSVNVTGTPINVTTTWGEKCTKYGCFEVERTSFECRLDITSYPSQRTGSTAACGCAEDMTAASPDQPRPLSPGNGRAFVDPPRCSTCDVPDLVLGGGGNTQDVLECLRNTLPDTTGDVRAALVARMKLLFQLDGAILGEGQTLDVKQLYDTDPAAAPACQEPIAVDATCASAAVLPDLNLPGQLQLCADLDADHVDLATIHDEMSTCGNVLAAVKGVPDASCRLELGDIGSDHIANLILRTTATYDPSDGLQSELVETLRYLHRWYDSTATAGAGQDPAWLRGKTSALVGRIWERAQDVAAPLPTTASSDSAAAALLADYSDTTLDLDWAMLRAAFDPSHPIYSPALLYVVGDALRGTVERLDRVTAIHDTACRFKGCAPTTEGGSPVPTATSQAWRAIAAIPDAAQLEAALASVAALDAQHAPLANALRAIRDHHLVLEQAYTWATNGGGAFADIAVAASPPVEGEGLAAVLRTATARTASYDEAGLFDATRARLSSAVLKRDQLVGFIDSALGELDGAKNAYTTARLDTVNDLLAQTRTDGATQSALDRVVAAKDQILTLVGHLGGLRAREESERAALAGYMDATEAVIHSGAFDPEAAYQVDVLPQIQIGPYDAKYAGGPVNLPAIRASVVTLDVGEVLDVDMPDATWTPTCAMQGANLPAPSGEMVGIDFTAAATGPEGYYLSWSGSEYTAQAYSSSVNHAETDTITTTVCIGAGATIAKVLSLGVSVQACSNETTGHTTSHGYSSSGGSESRTSASFNGGLRLPNTPFSRAPVGSLLAVITPVGYPDYIMDVRVVGRKDSILAPKVPSSLGTNQVEVHFVVNDVDGCLVTDDRLVLDLRVVTPVGLVAQTLATAMAESIDAIEAQAPAILAQGGLTPAETTSLATGAWARLTTAMAAQGYGLQGIPVELRNLYQAWIDQQIASIGRRGEIDRVQREIKRINLEMTALVHELSNLAAQSRLLGLIPRWRLRDLAGVRLNPALASMQEILTSYALPIYELRDPARLTSFRSSAAAQLDALLATDFAGPLDVAADNLRAFALSVRNSLAAAEFELPTTARRTLVLAFPRYPGACDGLCDEFKQAPPQIAEMVWSGIESATHKADLAVQAADLFALSDGNASLSCYAQAPVVRRASIYMLNPFNTSVDFTALGREVPAFAGVGGASFDFPIVGGVRSFFADDHAGVPMSLPIINGGGGDVITDFGASPELGPGAGISPFSTFSVDFGSFYTAPPLTFIGETLAVLLVVEVERRVGTNLTFVPGVCQDSVSP